MKGISKNIILAVVGFFFMLSACEISTDYFTNTFGDEYDYYVQPDNSNATNIYVHVITDFTLPVIPLAFELSMTEIASSTLKKQIDFFLYSPPLYLKNRILLV